jgi:SOS-response transcriptional repressor LexA
MDQVWNRIGILKGEQSLAEFCREVGIGYEMMRKCFQRCTAPDGKTLAQIARHFRADLQWLICGDIQTSRSAARVGKRLRQWRKKLGLKPQEFADSVSLRPAVLEFYEKGSWPIPTDLLAEFSDKLELPPGQLLGDEDSQPVQAPDLKIFQTSSARGTPKIRSEDYRSVPLTESSIAAGQPIIQQDKIEDYVLLHVRAAGRRGNLVACRVDGESMEPMLHSGDIVVIDRDDKKITKNKIYAIFYDDGLTAKYVEKQEHLLILRPLNPNSQLQVLNLGDHPDPVVGRIIGTWKEL